MMPRYRGVAELAGGVAGSALDFRQLPALLAGAGSGSLLKTLEMEALLGAASEAVTLPSQYLTAAELGKDDPDVL